MVVKFERIKLELKKNDTLHFPSYRSCNWSSVLIGDSFENTINVFQFFFNPDNLTPYCEGTFVMYSSSEYFRQYILV